MNVTEILKFKNPAPDLGFLSAFQCTFFAGNAAKVCGISISSEAKTEDNSVIILTAEGEKACVDRFREIMEKSLMLSFNLVEATKACYRKKTGKA